jgi:hypothetical protein
MADARQAAQYAGELLALAGADQAIRAKVGDLIAAARRGQPLPVVRDVRRRLGLGLDPGDTGMTAGEWMAAWLAGKQRTRRASAVRSYEMHIRVWLEPVLRDVPMERLNPGHIEAVFDRIVSFNAEIERQRAEGQALIEIDGDLRAQPRITGPSTKRRIYATLRVCLNDAVRKRMITWSPAVGLDLEPEAPAEGKRWTPAQAAQFITATAGDPDGAHVQDRGAARRAARGTVRVPVGRGRLGPGVLAVQRLVLQLGGKVTESTAKTRAGERLVFLDAETASPLREHRKAQLAARLRAGEDWQDHDLVFSQPDGRPWNPDHVSRRFRRLAPRPGCLRSPCTRAAVTPGSA